MALVGDRLCVDRWEASLLEVPPDGPERPWSPHLVPPAHGVNLRAVSKPDVLPQGHISGEQALAACVNAGKRLCTESEWVRACRGPNDTQYPYGNQRIAGVCNDSGRAVHPVAEAARRSGLSPKRMWYEGMDDPIINQLADTLRKTGERSRCTNGYCLYDMVGNLHEWIDDPAGTFRGGYFMDTQINGEGCSYATHAHPFSYHDYSTGFRCCRDADRAR